MDRHPGTDPDWKPSTYRFHDDKLAVIHTTQTPIDDESALAYFHKITSWGKEWNVAYISKAEPGSQEFKMLPYKFHEGMVEPL